MGPPQPGKHIVEVVDVALSMSGRCCGCEETEKRMGEVDECGRKMLEEVCLNDGFLTWVARDYLIRSKRCSLGTANNNSNKSQASCYSLLMGK